MSIESKEKNDGMRWVQPKLTESSARSFVSRWILTPLLNDAANSLLPGEWSYHCRDTETTILVNVVSIEQENDGTSFIQSKVKVVSTRSCQDGF